MSAMRGVIDRWRETCGIVRRRGGILVYVDSQIASKCGVCGFGFIPPTELVKTSIGLLHVACGADGAASVRGGA